MKGLVISGLIFILVFVIGAPVQARLLIPLADLEITDFNEEVGLIWNGSEEIIIQRMIIKADSTGHLLDLMPFPAEPIRDLYDQHSIFEVTRNNFINYQRGFKHPDYFFEDSQEYKKLDLVNQELIQSSDSDLIIGAINEFLAASSQNSIELTDNQLKIIEDYLNKNIEYFQLRLFNISEPEASRIDSWQFDSDILYYPLESNLTRNFYFTVIQSSPHLDFYDFSSEDFTHYIPPRITRPDVLRTIDPGLPDFFETILIYSLFWEVRL